MKQKNNSNIFKHLIIIILLSLISSFFLIKYYSNKISPLLIEYAEIKTKELALKVISKSLSDEIKENYPSNILNITRDSNNDIELMNYDTKELSNLLTNISSNIEKNLHILETGSLEELNLESEDLNNTYGQGLIYSIPLGVATNSVFLSNLGPQIPMKLKLNRDIVAGVNANIKNYGINNALLELDLTIEANIQVILPFTSKVTTVIYETPISIELINGKIPSYYIDYGLEYKNTQND